MSKVSSIVGGIIPGVLGGKDSAPEPAPLPPPVSRTDPAIEEARKRQRSAELERKGRRAAILTSGQGVTDELGTVARPEARAAVNLGGTS